MSFFDVLNLIGGLSLFLFGMTVMGQALERRAGNSLKSLLSKLTTNKLAGLFTGLGVTAVIQSSSATTVMVVGFVNSGLMTLRQAINVIMGANIGTTVTAWILSLAGINSDNFIISLFKPTSFTPVLALAGLILYMAGKSDKKKDTGMILLGFAVLMFGMDTMSGSVSGLADVPEFKQMFTAFSNPILGLIAGAVLTGIIQSSSASVGILQALSTTGAVTNGAAIPIIMGQNIGTCVTALISSVGTNKNARRAALVHLSFNVIGATIWLTVFSVIKAVFAPALFNESASLVSIAMFHSIFNVLCTMLLLPLSGLFEKLAYLMIPETKQADFTSELDERLLASPALALQRCRVTLDKMAVISVNAIKDALQQIEQYDEEKASEIRDAEEESDHLEDILGSYLVKLTSKKLSADESIQATAFMKLIGDYERISDHAVNLLESAEEMQAKGTAFSEFAVKEFENISAALKEILDLSYQAFSGNDLIAARRTEPLEQVIDNLKDTYRTRHILRLQKDDCSVNAGFIWSDLLSYIERVSDHCSNISGCVIDAAEQNMNTHQNLRIFRNSDEDFKRDFNAFSARYNV
ncbi:MAG: Na/Pi cotransporter family protein [Clostridiales bacterium]|jgi:phosphate:Na+ symporter|nr:Na/Pi cotransporter family protein [Clostridiales bacterium]